MRFLSRLAVILSAAALSISTAQAATAPSLSISPSTATSASGQAITFTVTASDGTTSNVSAQAVLTTNDPRGTTAGAVYTPGTVGTWTVQADYQSLHATATITVTPGAVQELVINPNSEPEPTVIGTAKTFTVVAYDAQSNIVPDQVVTWSVIGDIGTISKDGVFTPKKVGTGKVQTTLGTITGQVSVAVSAAPVANTNTTNTNTSSTNVNTNTSTANANTNTTNTNTSSTNDATSCTTLKPWAWILMLVLFLLVVAVLYALVPVTKIWPAIAALGAAAVLAFIQRRYGCDTAGWWAWVITLGTVALTATALQFRPKEPPLQQ